MKTPIVLISLAAVVIALILVIPTQITEATATEDQSDSPDGTVYKFVRNDSGGYHSSVTDVIPSDVSTLRIQSRLEGYEVWDLENGALSNCDKATTIVIPEAVKNIGTDVFTGCTSLKTLIFMGAMPTFANDSIPAGVEVKYLDAYKDSWKDYTAHTTSVFPVYTYTGATCSFTYYVLDDTATVHKHVSGTEIEIPSTVTVENTSYPVTRIGPSAFIDSEYNPVKCIRSVKIDEGVELIDVAAFKYNSLLETVTFPSTLKVISDEAFRMPIDNDNWNMSKLSSVTIPEGVEFIGFESFRMCYSLKEVTVPSTVVKYLDNPFRVCTSMEKITILSDKITTIPSSEYDECFALKEVSYAGTITSIGSNAFQNCYSLAKFNVPSSVTTIGDGAFQYCKSLTEITLPGSVTLSSSTFSGTPVQTLVLSAGGDTVINTWLTGTWTLPGSSAALSLLTIDTSDAVDLSNLSAGGFVKFTNNATNTTGGKFLVDGAEVTGANRAGRSFAAAESSWTEQGCHTVTLYVYPQLYSKVMGTVTGSGTYAAGSQVTITATPGRYVQFDGWSDGVKDATRTVTVDSDVSLTASFSDAVTYNVSVDVSPSKSVAVDGIGKYVSGTTATLTAKFNPGYSFLVWDNGSTELTRQVIVDKDLTLSLTAGDSILRFVAEGVSQVPYPVVTKDGASITLPAVTREGYTFAGWVIGEKTYAAGSSFTPSGDQTATAKWDAVKYTVTWNVDGKTTTQSYEAGATIVKPADPTKTGYTFAGWDPAVPETMPAKDVTFTATWKANPQSQSSDNTLLIAGAAVAVIAIIAVAGIFLYRRQ